MYQGGFRENPISLIETESVKSVIFDFTQPFNFVAPDYFRVDLRLAWRVEKEKYARTLSLDIQNATNYENYAYRYYDEFTDQIETKYQLGLIPLLTYRVEF